jgi:hypothetical protein
MSSAHAFHAKRKDLRRERSRGRRRAHGSTRLSKRGWLPPPPLVALECPARPRPRPTRPRVGLRNALHARYLGVSRRAASPSCHHFHSCQRLEKPCAAPNQLILPLGLADRDCGLGRAAPAPPSVPALGLCKRDNVGHPSPAFARRRYGRFREDTESTEAWCVHRDSPCAQNILGNPLPTPVRSSSRRADATRA